MVLDLSDVAYVYHFCTNMLHLRNSRTILERALLYKIQLSSFVVVNRELRPLELTDEEWDGIILVAGWLRYFRDATTEMSATKRPMLSHTHAIFRGLQDSVRQALRDLPPGTHSKIKAGLVAAQTKLGEYYYRFDQSPFYLWAAREFFRSSFLSQIRQWLRLYARSSRPSYLI